MVAPVNKTNDKFAQILSASSSQNSDDSFYDIDLDVKKINADNAHVDAFSILGCEEGNSLYFGCSAVATCVC